MFPGRAAVPCTFTEILQDNRPYNPIDDDKYEELYALAINGCNATIELVKCRREGIIAVKKTMVFQGREYATVCTREISMMKQLRHRNIVDYLDGWSLRGEACLYTEVDKLRVSVSYMPRTVPLLLIALAFILLY